MFWRAQNVSLDRVTLITLVCMKSHNVCVQHSDYADDGLSATRKRAIELKLRSLRPRASGGVAANVVAGGGATTRGDICDAVAAAGLRRPGRSVT